MLVGKALLTPLVVGCWANFGTTGAETHSLKLIHASDGRTVVQDTFAESKLSPLGGLDVCYSPPHRRCRARGSACFLIDQAEAERAFQLAERLASISDGRNALVG
jgi:hypothetical protein